MDGKRGQSRIDAIDILRGFVMVLMAIDHASETFNRGRLFTDSAFFFKPGTPLPLDQFLTRWITHLCAPTFVALAGTALAISTSQRQARGASSAEIDRHIATRGALILVFEVIWMSPVMLGGFGRVLCQVLFAIGASLLAMTLLRRLSDRALLALALVLAVAVEPVLARLGPSARGSIVTALIFGGGFFFQGRLIVAYPIAPWLSMMCLGWVLGRRVVAWRSSGDDVGSRASRALFVTAALLLGVFFVLRGANGFGNMMLLRESSGLADWLHVSKYPPSLTYVGLELGIASALLALLFRLSRPIALLDPLRVLGRAALFFYLLHLHALHLFGWITGWHNKLGVGSAYVGGVLVVVALYPACAAYQRYKSANPTSWTRYI